MARASAESSVDVCAAAQPCLITDVAHSGDLEVAPRNHATFENWTKGELQKYLNYRIGGINKYANYSRSRLIERLLLIETGASKSRVSRKERRLRERSKPEAEHAALLSSLGFKTLRKRSRKVSAGRVRRLPLLENEGFGDRLCENAACRARLSCRDEFCKRCSCCICKLFDHNKDPSIWIECSGDRSNKCGSSCHLECALKLGAAGVVKRRDVIQLDGSYSCVACGFITSLLGCWKKLLNVAKDARRIDVFTSRLWLAYRLLDGTSRYKDLHVMVADAVNDLDKELSPGGIASAMNARGLVTRVSCGASIQDRLETAVDYASSWPREQEQQRLFVAKGGSLQRVYRTRIDSITPDSAVASWSGAEYTLGEEVIGHSIWCRAAAATKFPDDPVCRVQGGETTTAVIEGLHSGMEYELRIVPLTKSGEFGRVETRFSTPGKNYNVESFQRLIEKGEESGEPVTTFRIREIANEFTTAAAAAAAAAIRPGQDESSTRRSSSGSRRDLEETNGSSVEEEKRVISETRQSTPKVDEVDEVDRFLCTEDMDEVLAAVVDRERIEGSSLQESKKTSTRNGVIEQDTDTLAVVEVCEQSEMIPRENEQHEQQEKNQYRFETIKSSGVLVVHNGNIKSMTKKVAKTTKPKNGTVLPAPDETNVPLQDQPQQQQQQQQRDDDQTTVPPAPDETNIPLQDQPQQQQQQQRDDDQTPVPPAPDETNIPLQDQPQQQQQQQQQRDDDQTPVPPVPAEKKRKKKLQDPDTLSLVLRDDEDLLALFRQYDERLDGDDAWTEEYMDQSLQFTIKVIVWLERQGHVESSFRLKILTWLGFRASAEEKKVMFVYVRTLLTEPICLAQQLVDTFNEVVSVKRLKQQS